MTWRFDKTRGLVVALIGAGLLLPIAMYWSSLGRYPTVYPERARRMLHQPEAAARLIDVRPAERFAESHVAGAENWPAADIQALRSAGQVPPQFRGKTLLLVCDVGWLSGRAAVKLRELGVANVFSVRGGIQEWIAGAATPCRAALDATGSTGWTAPQGPFRNSPAYEQWAAVLTGFGVKPAYMLLSLALVVVLWRQKAPDLVALKWGQVFFFIGEAFCLINYAVFSGRSYLSEYLHSYGMVLSFAFTTYAIFEGMDSRLINFSGDGKCAAVGLCRSCAKYADVPCGLRRTFLWLIPAMLVLAFMPLAASARLNSYNTRILGTLYNYSHPFVHQMFEIRICPVLALLPLAASMGVLLWKKERGVAMSKVLFAAGMGPLGFGLMRMFLLGPYGDNQVWFAFWEEITEFIFVCGAAYVLWVFRQGLFAPRQAQASPGGE